MDKRQTVAILGTGWLGGALVGKLVKAGYVVRCSYRSAETKERITAAGGSAFYLDLPHDGEQLGYFLEAADALVIALPPKGRSLGDRAEELYLAAIATLSGQLDDLWVIYTSSTGVYGGEGTGRTTEDAAVAPDTSSGRAVVAAENWLMKNARRLTILRLAGLYGPGRDPANFFRRRDTIPNGDAPVNMVHREDVLEAIAFVLRIRPKGIFNVCSSTHPTKRAFYGEMLRNARLPEKKFLAGGGMGKRIDSSRLRQLGWMPIHDKLI